MALLDHDESDIGWRPLRWRADHTDSALSRAGNDNRSSSEEPAYELDCLIDLLPPHVLQHAAARGRDLRIGADRVLIAAGVIDEDVYLQHLARHCGLAIETFADVTRADIALRDDQLAYAAQNGIVPVHIDGEPILVHALRLMTARRLVQFTARYPALTHRMRIASSRDMDKFLLHGSDGVLARDAATGLADRFPALSAAPVPMMRPGWTLVKRTVASLALAGLLVLPPTFDLGLWSQSLALWFIAAISLRLTAAFLPQKSQPKLRPLPDVELPIYTIIVALYREARSVAPLLHALNALTYPREKLDLILVTEADDRETAAAIARFGALPHLRVVIAPDIGPRTKPKALNCALPFARGSFIAVFDAEDTPDPGQLRAALDAFRGGGNDVACAQASLCIENVSDSLFTRMFAAEYAGQFDAVLPGFAAMRLPLPLGGSSNHFRVDALRAVGGWDSWNVTEDADLGLRLARFGYRAVTFASTTQEEAPIRFKPWLKQRSRWMKGWMQTWSVHSRDAWRSSREIDWRAIVTLNLVIGSHITSALAYPVFILAVVFEAARGSGWIVDGLLTPLHFVAIAIGLCASVAIGLRGLARRGRWRDGWILLLTPIYWGCLSIATWRALWQLLRDPYRWEKTDHGLTTQRASLAPDIKAMPPTRFARQRMRFRSAAASSGVRFRLNGAMNLPLRSIK